MSERQSRPQQGAAIALSALFVGGAASGQDAEAARRGLVQQAQGARAAGDHARALEFAERAAQLRMSASLRLFIAECHESLGGPHLSAAFNHASRCVQDASADASLQHRDRIFSECGAIVSRTSAQVARVLVRGADDALLVRVNGATLLPSERGAACAVAPGAVSVEAQGRDGQMRTASVNVSAGETREVSLGATAPAAVSAGGAFAPGVTAPVAPLTSASGPGAGPWVMLGAGLVVAALGGVFFGLQSDAVADRDVLCPTMASGQQACGSAFDRERAFGLHADAGLYNALGWASVGVGLAVAAGGVAWRLVARPTSERASSLRVGVLALGGGGMIGVGGTLP